MNIISWNVRGINNPSRAADLGRILREHEVGLLGLLETKVKRPNFCRIEAKLGMKWTWIHNYDSNKAGKVIIGWDKRKYSVTKLFEDHQVVHVRAVRIDTGASFFASFVYASNDPAERLNLWNIIETIHQGRADPWIVLGDLNNVMYVHERVGGNQFTPGKLSPYVTVVTMQGLLILNLLDLSFHGRSVVALVTLTSGPK